MSNITFPEHNPISFRNGGFHTLGEEEGRKIKIVTQNISIIHSHTNTVNLDTHFTLRRYVGILLKSTGSFKRKRAENSPVCGKNVTLMRPGV